MSWLLFQLAGEVGAIIRHVIDKHGNIKMHSYLISVWQKTGKWNDIFLWNLSSGDVLHECFKLVRSWPDAILPRPQSVEESTGPSLLPLWVSPWVLLCRLCASSCPPPLSGRPWSPSAACRPSWFCGSFCALCGPLHLHPLRSAEMNTLSRALWSRAPWGIGGRGGGGRFTSND